MRKPLTGKQLKAIVNSMTEEQLLLPVYAYSDDEGNEIRAQYTSPHIYLQKEIPMEIIRGPEPESDIIVF